MQTSLGMDEDILRKRNKRVFKYWKQFSAWRKGFEAGKDKEKSKHDNPYKLTPEMYKLLKKRTLWIIGYEEGDVIRHQKSLKRKRMKDSREKKSGKHKHRSRS